VLAACGGLFSEGVGQPGAPPSAGSQPGTRRRNHTRKPPASGLVVSATMEASSRIRPVDMRFLDELFGMSTGYVLDFNNQTFAEFFSDELGIDIDDPRYSAEGTSKGKRLRFFLRTADSRVRVRTLLALWEYRETQRRRAGLAESVPNAEEEFYCLVERLGGTPPRAKKASVASSESQVDRALSESLKTKLLTLSQLKPVERGYAYERFLRELFDANGLAARASFRLVGEQIDGSFQLAGETYLLEAKWTSAPVGVADLRAFNARLKKRPLGREDYLLAIVALRRTASQRLVVGSASYAWTA
jgi:hypothetical protein